MATVDNLRSAIAQVFRSWEEYPNPALSMFRIVGVMDTAHDRYTLTHIDFDGDRYKSHLLAYLEIRDGKIWILTDNTEDGIATELVAEGIAKSEIVLGFYPPALREAGEFAVN
jgi:Tfp pilus assembly protein PilP